VDDESLSWLMKGLYAKGFTVSKKTVARLLRQRVSVAGGVQDQGSAGHPDRDASSRISTPSPDVLTPGIR